mgnify:FL=1
MISLIAVPAFFMASGFLLQDGTSEEDISFIRLKKQCLRVLRLYLVWTIIFFPLNLRSILQNERGVVVCVFAFLQKFVFDGSWVQLWFLPSLTVGLLFVWLLRKRLRLNVVIAVSALIFVFGLFDDSWLVFCPKGLTVFFTAYNKVFLTTRNGIFFAPLFISVGEKLAQMKHRIPKRNAIAVLAGGIAACVFEGIVLRNATRGYVANMVLSDLPICIGLMILVTSKKGLAMHREREMSIFVYCFHPLAIIICGHFLMGLRTSVILACILMIVSTATIVVQQLKKKIKVLRWLY